MKKEVTTNLQCIQLSKGPTTLEYLLKIDREESRETETAKDPK